MPAEETDRTGLDVAAEAEEYWAAAGWLEGVRGGPLLPGSALELISHFGGWTVCLGGRGSRKLSCRASGSGTKWLSDSMNKNKTTKQKKCAMTAKLSLVTRPVVVSNTSVNHAMN